MSDLWAFRCRTCGRLETGDHAAESEFPHSCRVCGGGVVFRHAELAAKLTEPGADVRALAAEIARCDPATKRLVPENWEVLAEADAERLAELGLTSEQVDVHEPWPRGQVPEEYRDRHFGVPPGEASTRGVWPAFLAAGGDPRAVTAEAHEGSGVQDRAG